jgi:hypothetical protein
MPRTAVIFKLSPLFHRLVGLYRLKYWPGEQKEGITQVYVTQGSRISQVIAQDQRRFEEHPQADAFLRKYIPGEFEGMPLPDSMDINTITHVLVTRLEGEKQVRIPMTQEETRPICCNCRKLT